MITNLKDLKKYLKAGGKLKVVYHINPKTVILGTTRKVINLTNKEWVFEGLNNLAPSYAPAPKEEDIVFGDTKFSIKLEGKIIVTYEYVY